METTSGSEDKKVTFSNENLKMPETEASKAKSNKNFFKEGLSRKREEYAYNKVKNEVFQQFDKDVARKADKEQNRITSEEAKALETRQSDINQTLDDLKGELANIPGVYEQIVSDMQPKDEESQEDSSNKISTSQKNLSDQITNALKSYGRGGVDGQAASKVIHDAVDRLKLTPLEKAA